jgi:uncharacterized glyoxalase superfamily protein PhnB/cytoskeletal protein CcmA (bactofilin family)
MRRWFAVAAIAIAARSAFGACTVPSGFTKAWNGTTTAWSTAANWSPSGVPAGSDSVYICSAATVQPALTAAASVSSIQVDSGASLNFAGFTLTAGGNADFAASSGGGTLAMNGSGKTLKGSVPALSVSGTISLVGATTVNGNFGLSGDFTVGDQTITVTGNFTTSGLGDRLRMTGVSDRMNVNGDVSFNGGGGAGILTAGELHVGGNFNENNACCTGTAFAPSGTHTTFFDGSKTQTIAFTNPSSNNGFQNVMLGGSGTIANSLAAKPTAYVKGNLIDTAGNRWQVLTTVFIGATPQISNIQTNATFSANSALQNPFIITGNVSVTGTLKINGQSLTITGNLTTSGLGDRLTMLNALDRLIVQGDVSFNGGGATGILTAGELHVGGNFNENNACCTGTAFAPSGTHTTVFDGSKTQTVAFTNPSGNNGFQNVQVGGTGTIVNSLNAKPTAVVKGNLADPAGSRWQLINTTFIGATPSIGNIKGGATFSTNSTLQNDFTIDGNVSLTGTLAIGGRTLTVTGNFTTSGLSDRLTMTNAADRLIVKGTVNFNGGGATGILTAGELHVGGDFNESNACCTGTAFAASGSHTTVFDGGITQTIHFTNPGNGNSFQHAMAGGAATTKVISTSTVVVKGNLFDVIGNRWQATTTDFRGAAPSLPSLLRTNIVFSQSSTLPNGFTNTGNITLTGTLVLNGQTVTTHGDFTTSGLGDRLTMQNPNDKLIIDGNANFFGGGGTGLLTAGEIDINGNFTENNACCTGTAFVATGTHTTLFTGGATQTIKFNNPSSNIGFQNAGVGGNGTVVTSTSNVYVKGNLIDPAGNRWQASTTVFVGATPAIANIKATATFSANSALQNNFTIDGNLNVTGTLAINGHTINVTGSLTTSGLGDRLTMTNPADRLLVKGDANFFGGGGNGILTAGELHVGGNFYENNACCTGTAFVPSGTHLTVFDGTGAQTLRFNSPSTHFVNLRLNGPSMSLLTDIDATGLLSSNGGTLSGAGKTLGFAGLDVVGLTFDNVLAISNGGTLTRLDNATFQNYATAATQLTIKHPGNAAASQFRGNRFLTTPSGGGAFINAVDTASTDANKLTIQMINSTPADGSAQTTTSGGAIVQWLTIATNHNPTTVADVYSVDEDRTLAATSVLANDNDSDGDPLTATLVTPPATGMLDLRADGTFTYTPPRDFNGAVSFTYRADDGKGGSATSTATITVRPVNDAPVARDDAYAATSSTLTIAAPGVLTNDTDVDGDHIAAIIVTQPANGIVTLDANGAFTYTPRAGFSGSDTFTYAASDGVAQSAPATVTITVGTSTEPPTVNFRATASTIKSGDSVTLLWTTEHARSVKLLPDFGEQPLNGSISVQPAATTTYTLDVSAPSGTVSAQLTIEVVGAPSISVVTRPHGMLELPGQSTTDSYVIENLGGSSAQITLMKNGAFFTQSPESFTIAAGATQTITISAQQMPFGIYRGESFISGEGVANTLSVPIRLLSLSPPNGKTDASAASTRVDGSTTQTVNATFTNHGNATAEGLVVSDSPWIVPQSDTLTIPPGDSVTTTLQIDRSQRPDGDNPSGAITAGVSLLNLSGSLSGGLAPNDSSSSSVSVSTVSVKDLVPPSVSAGAIAPLAAGEVAYFVPGLAHRANLIGDLAVVNRSSTSSLGSVKLLALTSTSTLSSTQVASLPSLAPNVSFAMPDVMKGVFNQQSASASVMVRGDVNKVALHAATVAVGKGFFGGALAAFRSDRGAAKGELQFLAGVSKDATTHTDLHLQETTGAAATAIVDFLDAAGSVMATSTESLAPFGYIERVDAAPSGAAAVRVRTSDTSSGAVAARALVINQTSGDVTDVVDWSRVSDFSSSATRIIPYTARGANATTDLVLMNGGSEPATISLAYSTPSAGGRRRAAHSSAATLTIEAGETRALPDVLNAMMNVSGESSGYLMINGMSSTIAARATLSSKGTTTALPLLSTSNALHVGQGRQFVELEDAAAAAVNESRAGTFRTSFGLVETSGATTTVRATVHFSSSLNKVTLRAVAAKDFTLAAGKPLVMTDLVKSIIGDARNQYGDLHDVQLDIDVVSGDGGVIPFVMSTDNATGDTLFRWE